MPEKIITLYCFFDELLRALDHHDDPQCVLSTAQVMTVAAVAAAFFIGNQQTALTFLISHGYIQASAKSRFNRQLHCIPESLWQYALSLMARIHFRSNNCRADDKDNAEKRGAFSRDDNEFIVDSFPIPLCRNIRIKRCHIYRDVAFHGYNDSKKEYFYGVKACVIVAASGSL